MIKKTISSILFDLDGTLLDTAPDLAKALNIVLQQNNRATIPFAKIRPYSSTGTRGLINLGFQIDESHTNYQSLREQFLLAYHQHLYDETNLFPGIKEVLTQIENSKIPWGVVTNKPAFLAKQLLEKFNLSQECACVIGGDTLPKRKPDPDQLLHACEIIGSTPKTSAYVGDAERDIEAAKRANMTSIAALYGYIGEHENPKTWDADFYIKNPEEIIGLIRR